MVLDETSATGHVMALLSAINNGADIRTGIYGIVWYSWRLFGPRVPQALIDYNVGVQINLFGGYPTTKDIVPSAIFAVVFGLLAIFHILIFILNFSRGHYFFLSLAWAFYCILRVVGWVLRITWGQDIVRVKMGIANEVLLIIPSILLVSFNLILAQRLFTWRHPVGGSRKLFWSFMWVSYGFVAVVTVITIVASAIPYMYFLSTSQFMIYQALVKWSAIMIIVYSLTSINLIALSYFFKPTAKDENLYTYQPWWIESFAPFYFVKKNAAREAEETFMKRNHNHRHAIRVIAATHHHYNMVEGLTNKRGDLKHNFSLSIIIFSTLLIFVAAIMRAVVVFQARKNRDMSSAGDRVAMYIMWGFCEALINISYIVGRADLRFYRPDVLPAKVRAVITAEQTNYHSDEEEGPVVSEQESEQESDQESDEDYDFDFDNDDGFEFETKRSQLSDPPNYYSQQQRFEDKVEKGDDESEFYF
ncbi:uncharacterized protein PRCAT00003818001 [Priceomyces carsonii]|uniref:uncharacterized protein n=1 Tax=Priceomyces carsonii TaxID=28549 RepID=UPI002EDB842D|nr:unnamed protein product [Priceomyces carsonii]